MARQANRKTPGSVEVEPEPGARSSPAAESGPLDCMRCGACCSNPLENRAEGFEDWVEVDARAPLWRRRRLVQTLVVRGSDGRAHLRLDERGRCAALDGAIGQRVRCSIYALRPRACRKVEAGSPRCLQYRAEHGLP